MEKDLTQYVYEKMIHEAKSYQWRLVLDSHKRALEIYFVISVELENDQFVQDLNGQVNNKKDVKFEDVVCFYDETNHRLLPENYLKAIPFNPDVGIEVGLVDAFLKQLNIIISGSVGQLRSFLIDASQNEFELQWNETNMQKTIDTLQNAKRYSIDKLTFKEPKEKSIVEQFKGDQEDGLERI